MALSGEQWSISYAGHEATIVEVGGGLRTFTVDGKAYVDGYHDDELCPGGAGQVLAPWPNRLGDGRYDFDGKSYQVALSEPATRNAAHGLVRWLRWQAVDVDPDSVTVECALPAQPGYPFPIVLRTRWSVGPYGLRAVHTAVNLGATAAPFGLGVHPYLKVPGVSIADLTLELPAKTRLKTDDRKLPVGEEPVGATKVLLGETEIDAAFGDLDRDADGNVQVRLSTSDGRGVTLWADESFGWVQVYTADQFAGERHRRAIAVEPMSCPPDAFRSGRDLVTLGPGQIWSGTWGISPKR
ncbi:aldose 1-epimerase family protein [Phytomonospora endophytica]|uniref:Aldose 1-epimerase n=1 Tax=Phytomonospora endophytica TaxID=714109 RepID=A0A841FU36_9ACTN|nr:aldose 1-epimerase family protein [Phytomonospora endophytica]MBB6037248.1 aldose 1-epimerase [Phytomonospora endophytica]GIG71252.1 aldose 1-epimerase [Phytomonospora endophytica]